MGYILVLACPYVCMYVCMCVCVCVFVCVCVCVINNFRLIWVNSGHITFMKLDGTELKILPVSARLPELVVVYNVTHSYHYVGIIFDKTY